MELTEAVLTRRSRKDLAEPAPDTAEFTALLQAAASAPDHGRLRPWRWVLLRGAQRSLLGAAFAAHAPAPARDRAAAKARRAPLLASVVFAPRRDTSVPEWEQLAATAGVVHSLELLLHDRGWGSIWRTGREVDSPVVRETLGVAPDEKLLGWLYIGTPPPEQQEQSEPETGEREEGGGTSTQGNGAAPGPRAALRPGAPRRVPKRTAPVDALVSTALPPYPPSAGTAPAASSLRRRSAS
ncbi:nitroreductase family protein [Streptomyces daliensis]|uniref:Nitroreductase family protein n=1 Tax=Streptomyces daliensis TaxID=299421 RepID=A0A8T4IKD3_9ACTN|nr:nitroreductase family protein [Streptomyces daliensis]